MERLACFIAARNLGDIVIWSGIVRQLAVAEYAERLVVWTRPQAAWLFKDIPHCELICSAFPVGTVQPFRAREALGLFRAALSIRKLKPSVSIDLVGDFRERMLARMIGSKRHLHIGWDRVHPYSRLIRNPFGVGTPSVVVPAAVPNVYDGCTLMINRLLESSQHRPFAAGARGSLLTTVQRKFRVGIHPFASQRCKMWPVENWRLLVADLVEADCEVIAFGSPRERTRLLEIFEKMHGSVGIVTGDLGEFASAVSKLDVMVGLDSFSVHMAHRQNIISIMINAGAPSDLWIPPGGRVLASSGGCVRYPCFNVAPCKGTTYENACVNAISPTDVMGMIRSIRMESRGSLAV